MKGGFCVTMVGAFIQQLVHLLLFPDRLTSLSVRPARFRGNQEDRARPVSRDRASEAKHPSTDHPDQRGLHLLCLRHPRRSPFRSEGSELQSPERRQCLQASRSAATRLLHLRYRTHQPVLYSPLPFRQELPEPRGCPVFFTRFFDCI